MFNFNIVREVLYGIGIIVALAVPWPGVPNPWAVSGWSLTRWILAVLIIIVLFFMLVSGPSTVTVK